MLEIEVKFLNISVADIERKLKRLGAKKVFGPVLFRDTQFSHPTIGKRYTLFRLRQENAMLTLTLKKRRPGGAFKVEEEQEIALDSGPEEVLKMLATLGFKIDKRREKFRTEYKLELASGKLKVEIDSYPRMKPYLEIESASRKAIRELAAKLGLDFKEASNETATVIIRKAGLNPDKLLFGEGR